MIQTEIRDIPMEFETGPEVFSPSGIDLGTLSMLSLFHPKQSDKVLDLGCGYGVVGIFTGKLIGSEHVVMCDLSEDAIDLSRVNAVRNSVPDIRIIKSNGLDEIPDYDFTYILSNPPYHEDFSVPKSFIENGYKKLVTGGKMMMVTKRLDWYKNKLSSVFGGVKIVELNGYHIFIAEKRIRKSLIEHKNKNQLSKKLRRKYNI